MNPVSPPASSLFSGIIIRPYEPRDREAVRAICCDTADRGESVEHFFPDREIFADLLTRYYTDIEPGSCWVGEQDGTVVGYLTGCLDTRRFRRAMLLCVLPPLALKALRRRIWAHPQARQFIRSNFEIWLRYSAKTSWPARRFPSHLHINLNPGFRAQGLGAELVSRFIEQAAAAGRHGIYANVREDSPGARAFFERLGFQPVGRRPIMKDPSGGAIIFSVIYGRGI